MQAQYKRVLLKLSGEVLGGSDGSTLDRNAIQLVTGHIAQLYELGVEVGIVVGGGNIFRGARSGLEIGRVSGDHMGMLATVINSICLQESLEQREIHVRVMTAIEMPAIAESYVKRRAVRHLEKGRVCIFAAGTGNPFFTTDTAAVLRASEINAEIVIKATKTDGVYDKDPALHSDAVRYTSLSYGEVLQQNLQVMDSTAIAFCQDNRLPIVVLDIHDPRSVTSAVCGEGIGTTIKS